MRTGVEKPGRLESLFISVINAGLEDGTTMDAKKIESLWSHVHGLGVLHSAGSFTAAAQRLGLS